MLPGRRGARTGRSCPRPGCREGRGNSSWYVVAEGKKTSLSGKHGQNSLPEGLPLSGREKKEVTAKLFGKKRGQGELAASLFKRKKREISSTTGRKGEDRRSSLKKGAEHWEVMLHGDILLEGRARTFLRKGRRSKAPPHSKRRSTIVRGKKHSANPRGRKGGYSSGFRGEKKVLRFSFTLRSFTMRACFLKLKKRKGVDRP